MKSLWEVKGYLKCLWSYSVQLVLPKSSFYFCQNKAELRKAAILLWENVASPEKGSGLSVGFIQWKLEPWYGC